MNNRVKEIMTKFVDWFKGLSTLTKIYGAIYWITALISLGLLGTVISLNMLPILYLVVVSLAVVFLLFGIYCLIFQLDVAALFKKKIQKKKLKEKTRFIRTIAGLVLSLCLVIVDAVGINMIIQLQGTLSEITGNDVAMEYVGVYVLVDDKAEELKDVRAYDLGLSYAYDKESIQTAVQMMEDAFNKEMDWNEYDTVTDLVDALLAGEVDAMLLNTAYLSILTEQDNYTDIESKIKLIHEFCMEDDDAVDILSGKPEDITAEPFIVYISGNDTKSSLTNVRSDVNILAVVNPVTKQVLLINTPRDYYVELSGSGDGDGDMDKLTHCGIYGINCSMSTLGDLYDQEVYYYAQVSFNGFTRLINAMGGISVYSDATFYASESGTQIYKGYNNLNGQEALGFVRERHNLADGDNARGRHQMAVIQAIIAKAASGTILTHYSEILGSMGGCFGTNLTDDEISNLVKMQLSDLASWNVKSFSVQGDGYGSLKQVYSIPGQNVYVLPQNEAYVNHAQDLIDKVFAGETLTDEDLVLPAE